MKAVGEFKLVKSGNQTLELFPGMNISWSEDGQQTSPPVDTPPCGFNFELCSTASPGKRLFVSLHLFVCLLFFFSFLILPVSGSCVPRGQIKSICKSHGWFQKKSALKRNYFVMVGGSLKYSNANLTSSPLNHPIPLAFVSFKCLLQMISKKRMLTLNK